MFDRTLRHHAIAIALLAAFAAPHATAQDTAQDTTSAAPAVLGTGDSGDAVLEVQVRLDRAHFSPGEIDGAFGSNSARAVSAFQRAHGLEASGRVDAATLAALPQEPALVDYTLTANDVDGPFVAVPSAMEDKAKLERLGYASALEGIAERFHASPKLLQKLNPGKSFSTAGETIRVPNVEGSAPLPPVASVVVDKSDASVLLMDAAGGIL